MKNTKKIGGFSIQIRTWSETFETLDLDSFYIRIDENDKNPPMAIAKRTGRNIIEILKRLDTKNEKNKNHKTETET